MTEFNTAGNDVKGVEHHYHSPGQPDTQIPLELPERPVHFTGRNKELGPAS